MTKFFSLLRARALPLVVGSVVGLSAGLAPGQALGDLREANGAQGAVHPGKDARPASESRTTSKPSAHARALFGSDRTSRWSEIVVDLANLPSTAVRGTVELSVVSDSEARYAPPKASRIVVHRESFESRGYAALSLRVPAESGRSYRVVVRDGAGTLIGDHSVNLGDASDRIILAAGFPTLPVPRVDRNNVQVPDVVAVSTWPRLAETYDGVSLVALGTLRWPTVDSLECAALARFVREGGTVALFASSAPTEAGCGLGPLDVDGETVVGHGRIVQTNLGYAKYGDQTRDVVEDQMAARYTAAAARRAPRYTFSNTRAFFVADYGSRVAAAGTLLFGFAALAGPVMFFVLRRRRQTHRVLSLLPPLSIATFALMWGLGATFKGEPRTKTLSYREFMSGEVTGRATVARGFLDPKGVVSAAPILPGSHAVWERFSFPSGDRGAFRVDAEGAFVLNEKPFSDFVYVVESADVQLSAPVTIACTTEECTITNETGRPIEHATFQSSHGYRDLGRIDKTATVTLERAVRVRELAFSGWNADDVQDFGIRHVPPGGAVLVGWQDVDGIGKTAISVTSIERVVRK